MKRKLRNVSCGLLLIAIAALLIANQLGYEFALKGLGWFDFVILAICACATVGGLIQGKLWEAAFGIGIGYCVVAESFGLPEISWWIMLLAIGVGGCGLKMIFRGNKKHTIKINGEECVIDSDGIREGDDRVFSSDGEDYTSEDILRGDVVFSSMVKYVESKDFRGGSSDVVFSHVKYYFDRAELHDGYARVELSSVFSGVDIYVPRDWNIENNMDRVFGSCNVKSKHGEAGPTLILDGECVFGSVTVHFV